MAHQQIEGSETRGADTSVDVASIDINEWLKSNRLTKLKVRFQIAPIAFYHNYLDGGIYI